MTAAIEEADQMRERFQDMIRAEMAREDHDDYNRARGEVLFRIGRRPIVSSR